MEGALEVDASAPLPLYLKSILQGANSDDDQDLVYAALPMRMAGRIREEIVLQRRRRVADRDRLLFVRQVLASLRQETAPRSLTSFIRPARRDR